MKNNCEACKDILKPKNLDKWRFSLIGAIIVISLFNPYAFKMTNNIFGFILNRSKCPTVYAYIIHTIVYILLVRLSMEF